MSLTPAMIDAMVASGCSAEQIAAIVKADMADGEARREAKRENNAERQRRFRANRASRKNNAGNALPRVTPPIERDHTPSSDISPDGEIQNAARGDFPKPDFCESDQVWRDFLKNRKRKRLPNTATAYDGFLADVRRIADDEWPPGRLLTHAAAKGWGGIYDPREGKANGQHPQHQRETTRQTGERVAARYAAAGGGTAKLLPGPGSPGWDARERG